MSSPPTTSPGADQFSVSEAIALTNSAMFAITIGFWSPTRWPAERSASIVLYALATALALHAAASVGRRVAAGLGGAGALAGMCVVGSNVTTNGLSPVAVAGAVAMVSATAMTAWALRAGPTGRRLSTTSASKRNLES